LLTSILVVVVPVESLTMKVLAPLPPVMDN
jgi:hypothetical protein